MPSKIESSLTPEEFWDFCARVAQMKGGRKGATLKQIREFAAEWDITISENSAKSFRDGAFAEFLDGLKADKEMAEHIAGVAQAGLGLDDAASKVLEKKLFKTALSLGDHVDPETADMMTKSVERIRTSNRNARRLDSDLAVAKKKIEVTDVRVRELVQKIELQQFDAATAVLAHAKEIRLVVADTKLDTAAKTERVRKILFGERPADFKPVTTTGTEVTS